MASTQSLDFSDLGATKVSTAVDSSPSLDFSDLGAQRVNAPTMPTPTASVSAAPRPTLWERFRAALPIVDRAEYGLRTGFASPRTTDTAQALAKPPEAMSEERAIAPEQTMTPAERQAHPIATGVGEIAGGLTTPGNMLNMAMMGGKLPGMLARPVGGYFALNMAKGAWDELPYLREAWQRGDSAEVQRIFTHVLLGGTLAGLGVRYAVKGEPVSAADGPVGLSIYEGYRRVGAFFDKLKSKSINLDHISEAATGLYNSIRQDMLTHQAVLQNDGARTIQDAINADKAALMNTNRGSIPTAKAVGEVAKMITATDYRLKPAEQGLFNRIINQPEVTLEQAKNMRTAVGRLAFGRTSVAPEAKGIFTAAYNELGEGMKARIQELQGTTRPYEHYNNQFKASFELEDGIAGDMMQSLQGKDRHAAMPKMDKFADANLSEIQEQMRKIGLAQQADKLEKAQTHARSLIGAYDVANGKYASGIYRLFQQNPRQTWPGIAVMMTAHGMKMPFPFPQIAGAVVASGHIAKKAGAEAARISDELHATLPPEYFRTRTEAEAPETFTYKDPDEEWGGIKRPSNPAEKAIAIKQAMSQKRRNQ